MTEFTSKYKVYPTPYLFDKIYTISPEFTWDLKNFVPFSTRSSNKSAVRNLRARLQIKTRTCVSLSLLRLTRSGRWVHQTCRWTSTTTRTDSGIP